MTGAAIATAGMSVVSGVGARKDAKNAQKASDREAGKANEYTQKAADMAQKGVEYSENALKQIEESYGKNSEQYQKALESNNQALDQSKQALDSSYQGLDQSKLALEEHKNALGQSQSALEERRNALGQSELALGEQKQGLGVMKDNQQMAHNFSNFMNSLGEQGMEYAQGLMDNWESSFGGVQDNLTEYYNNLDPEKFATQNKADYKQALDKQMGQFNETMAASGLQSAGMKQQTAKEAMFKTAEANSQIDLAAEDQVAQMQQGFLQFGEGQRQGAENAMGNAQSNQGQFANIGQGAVDAANRGVANAHGNVAGAFGNVGNAYNNMAQGQLDVGTAYGNVANAYNTIGNRYNNVGQSQLNVGNAYNNVAQGERQLGGAYLSEGNAIAQGQESIGNRWGNVGNAYQNQAIQANSNAQNYGNSAAGYQNAAGNNFGTAMQAGVQLYDQYNTPASGIVGSANAGSVPAGLV